MQTLRRTLTHQGFEQVVRALSDAPLPRRYNIELLKPLKTANKLSLEGLQKAVVGFLTCKSSSKLEAQVGFILFNVLTFWLGATEALFQLNLFGILWNAGLSCKAEPNAHRTHVSPSCAARSHRVPHRLQTSSRTSYGGR